MATQPKTGTIVFKDGTYFLEAEGKHHVIPVGANVQPAQLKELVGKKVDVLYSEPKSFIVGLAQSGVIKGPRIICYVPSDPWAFGVGRRGGACRPGKAIPERRGAEQ